PEPETELESIIEEAEATVEKGPVIEMPSADDVTAALMALNTDEDDASAPSVDNSANVVVSEPATTATNIGMDEADEVAAALAAFEESQKNAAEDTSTKEEGQEEDGPSGWFQAQQQAESAARQPAPDTPANDPNATDEISSVADDKNEK
ncbi:MAG: hypothetical protein GWP36_01960, partial [Bacteroidetes bacterium]|nr:hypothetical protein [Bacteroidota bacterium]